MHENGQCTAQNDIVIRTNFLVDHFYRSQRRVVEIEEIRLGVFVISRKSASSQEVLLRIIPAVSPSFCTFTKVGIRWKTRYCIPNRGWKLRPVPYPRGHLLEELVNTKSSSWWCWPWEPLPDPALHTILALFISPGPPTASTCRSSPLSKWTPRCHVLKSTPASPRSWRRRLSSAAPRGWLASRTPARPPPGQL